MTFPDLNTGQSSVWGGIAYWRFTSVSSAIVILAAAIFNLLINPFSIYGIKLIAHPMGMYEKKFKLYNEFKPPANVLILGSSRVMTLDPEIVENLTGERCFNFWLPGAATETYYAVLKLALTDMHDPIDTVIVGAGIEAFHPSLGIQPEARYIPELSRYFIHDPHGSATIWDKIGLLFTMDQTLQSAQMAYGTLRKSLGRVPQSNEPPKLEYRYDGFTVQAKSDAQIDAGNFDLDAKIEARLRNKRYTERSLAISGWTGLSHARTAYWEDFLKLCKQNDIKVYTFMPPAHPKLIALLSEFNAQPIFDQVSDYLKKSTEENGGTFRDYTDIDNFNGDPNLFYDELHIRKGNGDRILENLLKSR